MPHRNQNSLYGIIFMLINAMAVSSLYTATKAINKDMNPTQVVFFYKFMVLMCMLPWIFRHGMKVLRTSNFKLHILRGFCSIFGSLSFMYGLKYVDLINATAIGYLEQVLWAIVGVLYFKERLTKLKVFAIALSAMGAILVVYPYAFVELWGAIYSPIASDPEAGQRVGGLGHNFNFYYLFIFAGVAFWTLNVTVIKLLGNKAAKNDTQAFYVLLFAALFSYPVAFMKWEPIEIFTVNVLIKPIGFIPWSDITVTPVQWALLLFMAAMYFIHVIAFFLAVKYADISTVTPFDYTRLIFTAILGIIFVNASIPTPSSYYGYVSIVVAGLMLLRAEYEQKRRGKKKRSLEEAERLEIEIENV